MKKIVILVLGLFLVSGLFAEWKKVEIPAKLTTVVDEAYDNENCRITKTFDGHIEVWFYEDEEVMGENERVFIFEYDESLWNKLKENGNTDLTFIYRLAAYYGAEEIGK